MTDAIVVPQAAQCQRLKALVLDSVSPRSPRGFTIAGLTNSSNGLARSPRPGFTNGHREWLA